MSPYVLHQQKKQIRAYFEGLGIDLTKYDFELETLVKYVEIENGKLNLNFELTNKSKDFKSEKVLNDNDVFIGTGLALGFIKTPVENDKPESIENQNIIFFNSYTEFTYTDPSTNVTQAKALESIYYSRIVLASSNDQLISNFDARNLKRVPDGKLEGHYQYRDSPFFTLTEYPLINGDDATELKIDPPSADTKSASGDTDNERTYAVLLMQGFKIPQLAKDHAATLKGCKCVK